MELPLFPLHLVLFPGRPLPLHLFEPRYRLMLRDCLQTDRRFGVVAIQSGQDTAERAEIFKVGTIARIETVQERSDGRFDIVTRGLHRFKLLECLDGEPYLRGLVEPLREPPCTAEDELMAEELRALLMRYLAGMGAPREFLDHLPLEPAELGYLAAAAIEVDVAEQQQLLELDSATQRLIATTRMLRREFGIMRHLGTVGSFRPPSPNGAQLN